MSEVICFILILVVLLLFDRFDRTTPPPEEPPTDDAGFALWLDAQQKWNDPDYIPGGYLFSDGDEDFPEEGER